MTTQLTNKRKISNLEWEKNSPRINMNASLYLYVIIAAFGIFAQFFCFWFFSPKDFQTSDIKLLLYFTNQSCLLMTLDAIAMAIALNSIKKRNLRYIPKPLNIINLLSTTSVALTMFVSMTVLLPALLIVKDPDLPSAESLFRGANFMFHLIIPIFSIFAYMFYAKDSGTKKVEVLYTAIPVVLYIIFYIVMAYAHRNPDGTFKDGYDWYWFLHYGLWPGLGMSAAMIGCQLGLGFLLRFGNVKIKVDKFVVNFFVQSAIVALSLVGTCWYFKDESFAHIFVWFTNWSNWFYAVTTVIYLVYLGLEYNHKIKKLPLWFSEFRLCGATALMLTFVVVMFVFVPVQMLINKESISSMFMQRNLFFHVLIPLIGFASYLAFEHNKLTFRQTLYALIAPVAYMIIYTIIGYVFRGSTLEAKWWDWYTLSTLLGKYWSWIMPFGTAVLSLLISSILWIGNRKNDLESDKPILLFEMTRQYMGEMPSYTKKRQKNK